MATKDDNRITKDTSARKSSSIRANAEAKVDEKKRYELIIETMQDDFDQEFESREAAHADEKRTIQKQHQKTLADAVESATRVRDYEIEELKHDISDWERKYKELQNTLQAELEKKKDTIAAANAETVRIREQARNKDHGRVLKIQELTTKIAIEIKFSCKGGSTRTYL